MTVLIKSCPPNNDCYEVEQSAYGMTQRAEINPVRDFNQLDA